MQRKQPAMAHHTSAHPLDTDILDLVEGTLGPAEEQLILAHLASCLLCRIKRQRLSAAAPVEFSDPRGPGTPAFAQIEVRHEDSSAVRAGELWITADDDGGMVLVRKVRSSGLVVVPVTLDVEVADDETIVLDEAASPLGLPLAIYERLTISIPFEAIAGRVIPIRDDIDLLALISDSVGVSRGSAIDGSTDPRLEIRQYLTDRLTALDVQDDEEPPTADDFTFDERTLDALFADIQEHLALARNDEASISSLKEIGAHSPAGWSGVAIVNELNVRVLVVDTPRGISGPDDFRAAEAVLALWDARALVVCNAAFPETATLYEPAGLRGSISVATGERTRGPSIARLPVPDVIAKFLDQHIKMPDEGFGEPTRGSAVDREAILAAKVTEAVAAIVERGSRANIRGKKLGYQHVDSALDALHDLLPAAFTEDFNVQAIINLANDDSQ